MKKMEKPPNPVSLFLSYAHEDESLLRKLEAHLSLLERQGFISTWYDRQIVPGADWAETIDEHLEQASIILLLVSPDFLASDYCYQIEMRRALERHQDGQACVIPIAMRPADWNGVPFAHLQALPTDAKPITTWDNLDEAFVDVATGIRRVIGALHSPLISTVRATFPNVWNIPYRRNPYFTGRDELLDRLHQQLTATGQDDTAKTRRAALTQPQAIKGLGGIGKTQIAVEYAYRSHDLGYYTHTLWVNAASEETITTSLATIAELLPSFPAKNETDQQKLVEAIKRWLEQCEQRWLLIFDNADDVSIIKQYLPQRGNGSLLLTTRANAVGSLAASLEVETMGLMEGTHLLLRRSQRFEQASDEEINEAGNIVVALDYFPLALDQAGAYIEEAGCGFGEYLEVYQDHRKDLLARRGAQMTNYPDAVATTWSLSFQKVEQANPAAAELLHLCAFLAPDHIPEELIRDGSIHWTPLLQKAATDLFAFNQMMAELLRFSLVKRLAEAQTLSIHRLIQTVQMDMMEPKVRGQWADRVVRAVNRVFPNHPQDMAAWPQCLRYLDQAQACNTLINDYKLQLSEAADLLDRAGLYLHDRSSYALAEQLYERALKIRELAAAQSQHRNAYNLFKRGKYQEAESLLKQALATRERYLGPGHPDVASSLHNLALIYYQQGHYEQAQPLYLRALAIRKQQLGDEHQETAQSLTCLAVLYKRQRKYQEAESLLKQALATCEQQLKPDPREMARHLNNLAGFYFEQSMYELAEPLYRRALDTRVVPDHPDTATSLGNLAGLYAEQGKYEDAEPLFQRALDIDKNAYGPEHPDVAMDLNNLADLYQLQDRYDEAEPLYQRALAIREQYLGAEHLDTSYSLYGLAKLFHHQRKHEQQAENFYRRALAIREQQLGPTHPETQDTRKDFAVFLRMRGRDEEAKKLEEGS